VTFSATLRVRSVRVDSKHCTRIRAVAETIHSSDPTDDVALRLTLASSDTDIDVGDELTITGYFHAKRVNAGAVGGDPAPEARSA
jgi:hypothetical protein